MNYEPPYEEDGRVIGLVKRNFYDREYGFLTDVNGMEYFFLSDDAKFGCSAGHVCLLSCGVECSFRAEPDSRRPGMWKALDIKMVYPSVLPEIEESVIHTFHTVHGWAARTCPRNCNVFVRNACVLSDIPSLSVGDRIRHRTILTNHRGKPAWEAKHIDVYLPD